MNVFKHQRSANRISLAAVLIVALVLTACSSSQIVSTLQGVVTAAEVAIPVIGAATGLPPATSAQIVTYLQAVNAATGQASMILAGPGTSAEKAARILAIFAQVSSGLNLPAGTPAEVLAVVNGVVQAVIQFLSNFPTTSAATPPAIKISAKDQITLSNLKLRSDANLSKLKGMKR